MIYVGVILVLGVLTKGIFADEVLPAENNEANSTRIIYGHPTDISRYPFFAGLRHCGGAILDKKWVITAAHCVNKYSEKHRSHSHPLWVGGNTKDQSQKYHFKKVFIHPNYDGTYNDIALVKLDKKHFKFGRKVKTVRLPQSPLCGYGYFVGKGIDETGHKWSQLKFLGMFISPNKYGDNYLASRDDGYRMGICHGDFGGPLVNEHFELIGIARKNYNPENCLDNTYTYFVDVSRHLNFIHHTMRKYGNDEDEDDE